MTLSQRTLAATAALALVLPATTIAAPSAGSGKAGAPGQVCKSLNVKGKKSAEQKAARKACIKQAVADRKAANEAKPAEETTEAPAPVEPAPAPVEPAPTA